MKTLHARLVDANSFDEEGWLNFLNGVCRSAVPEQFARAFALHPVQVADLFRAQLRTANANIDFVVTYCAVVVACKNLLAYRTMLVQAEDGYAHSLATYLDLREDLEALAQSLKGTIVDLPKLLPPGGRASSGRVLLDKFGVLEGLLERHHSHVQNLRRLVVEHIELTRELYNRMRFMQQTDKRPKSWNLWAWLAWHLYEKGRPILQPHDAADAIAAVEIFFGEEGNHNEIIELAK